jgi:hypothetical protein
MMARGGWGNGGDLHGAIVVTCGPYQSLTHCKLLIIASGFPSSCESILYSVTICASWPFYGLKW